MPRSLSSSHLPMQYRSPGIIQFSGGMASVPPAQWMVSSPRRPGFRVAITCSTKLVYELLHFPRVRMHALRSSTLQVEYYCLRMGVIADIHGWPCRVLFSRVLVRAWGRTEQLALRPRQAGAATTTYPAASSRAWASAQHLHPTSRP